ncbi:MAG: DMT family transporter [Alphaproteobacteria bacterium]
MQKSLQQSAAVGIAFGFAGALIWGTWPALSRLAIQQTLTPLDIVALRFAIAGPLLLPLIWRRGLSNIGWRGALLLTFGAGAPYVVMVIWGLQFAPASHFGIIGPSAMLTFSTLGGWLILGDKPSRARVMGLAIILGGVALIGWQVLAGSGAGDRVWIGDGLFVVGGFLWAGYTVGGRYLKVDPLHATAVVAVFSMVIYLPLYAVFVGPLIFAAPLSELLFQGIYQGVFVSILALLFYTRAVAILGAGQGAVFGALIPGLTVLWAFPLLGEIPTWRELAGVVAASGGMVLALGLFRRPAAKQL